MSKYLQAFTTGSKLVFFLTGASLLLASSGCGSLGVDGSLGAAQVRFVQVSSGSPDLDLYVNGTGAAYSLGFASFSSYLPVSPGSTNLSVTKAGSNQTLAQTQGSLSGGRQYTAVVSHGLGNLQERVYADQDAPAPQGTLALRVLNEVEPVSAIKIYVVPLDVPTSTPSVLNVPAGSASGYINLSAAGSYTVTATVTEGALNLPVASATLKAGSGAVRTVVFAGSMLSGGHGAVGFVLDDLTVP